MSVHVGYEVRVAWWVGVHVGYEVRVPLQRGVGP
jgi:hypothetical protein